MSPGAIYTEAIYTEAIYTEAIYTEAIYTELATRTSVADSGMGVLGKGAGGAARAKAHAVGDSSSVKDADEARITFTEALASRSGCSVGVGLPGRHTERLLESDSHRDSPFYARRPRARGRGSARLRSAPPHHGLSV